MHRTIALPIIPAVIMGFMTAASALVPSGQASYDDYARAQTTEAATLPASAGRNLVIASYTLAPRADSGWSESGGPAVLAVSSGTLLVHSAAGCATREYTVGQAAVIPAGRHMLSNPGEKPLAFSGAFLDGAADGITPFLDEADTPAPAGCSGVAGNVLRTAPSGASMVRSSRGVFVGPDAYRHSAHAHHAGGINMEAGKDIYVVSYRAEPGATTGWMTHLPTLGIVTKGTLTYYEAHDGRCVKSGEFSAGQAYIHASPVTHMAVNEGPGVWEATYVYFNLPHNAHPLPVAGNQTDAVNFAALPPRDCPRLK